MGVQGLDLHSRSLEPVNFLGAQSSLGGEHNFRLGERKLSFGGARPRNAPRGAGPVLDTYEDDGLGMWLELTPFDGGFLSNSTTNCTKSREKYKTFWIEEIDIQNQVLNF